ncbi:hypothetical protein MHLP_03535 [Candidatus Mycoplasma haematolamae str. Purdue]|uniref:Uncharacterized protein n=1 Tax=Mycoplasma haematolamae (strain Purdue) TaxID=1212765 RepID=I7C6V5_MYCHA|nr:hypothetical protein [Candidatus Mycoplasma haematolamae]AFO52277.1 hypothetical protein MHLP_03485 [Candidatus Mycoplasma haematolamae str. Purdue]AFO52287.1 hypothetical protein MHLP_03535 [Candidatus Mycoplasma haematolamae str. Purdue]
MIEGNKDIAKGMPLKLEKILELQNKSSLEEAWSALPGIIDELVKFQKTEIKLVQGYASKAGVKFAREAWKKVWTPGDKVDSPVSLVVNALRNREFSKVCSEEFKGKNSSMTEFFKDECDKTIQVDGDSAQRIKVVDVLKSAYESGGGIFSSSTWNVAKKGVRGGWARQASVESSNTKSDLKSKGYSNGLVAEQCPQLGFGLGNLDFFSATANKKVCERILEAAFGPTVSDKRYCL